MAQCKYCGEKDKKWYKDPESGRFSLLDEDGSRHLCQSFNKEKTGYADFKPQFPSQPQQQQQQVPQINGILPKLDSLSEQLTKLTELYSDIMSNMIEIAHAAKDASSNSRKVMLIADKSDQFLEQARITDAKVDRLVASFITHNLNQTTEEEKRAQQELEYDKDKEDGLI